MQTPPDEAVQGFLETLSHSCIRTVGPELIFGTLFDRIGFGQIPDRWFRHLVLARLAYPTSKRKTVDYLYHYQGITVSVSSLHAVLEIAYTTATRPRRKPFYQHTQKRLRSISVVFYDMTTLYFETEEEDDLRKVWD